MNSRGSRRYGDWLAPEHPPRSRIPSCAGRSPREPTGWGRRYADNFILDAGNPHFGTPNPPVRMICLDTHGLRPVPALPAVVFRGFGRSPAVDSRGLAAARLSTSSGTRRENITTLTGSGLARSAAGLPSAHSRCPLCMPAAFVWWQSEDGDRTGIRPGSGRGMCHRPATGGGRRAAETGQRCVAGGMRSLGLPGRRHLARRAVRGRASP